MRQVSNFGKLIWSVLILVLASNQLTFAQTDPQPNPNQSQARELANNPNAALHDKLAKYLTGTKWTGQFMIDGQDESKTEHYEILLAEKNEVGDSGTSSPESNTVIMIKRCLCPPSRLSLLTRRQ